VPAPLLILRISVIFISSQYLAETPVSVYS
jgi:hypothetical protein